jgi:NAD(P)-dependent dehydrogenase (short-subunit alcohol dehydrogenase family)
MASTVLITGASRGLGLEFARQYAADGWTVIATCRDAARAADLKRLEGDIEIHGLDVSDVRSIDSLARALEGTAIDVLLLNAAVHLQKDCTLAALEPGRWLEELRINVVAPIMVARRFIPHVASSRQKRIVAISSGSGSTTRATGGGNYAYRSGKAALNNAMKILAADVSPQGIVAVPIAPGHTRTDMGGAEAPYSAEDSVARVREVIARLRPEDSGGFFNRDGSKLPW